MTAAAIAKALGDAQRQGREWRARCPVHGGRSLTLADARDGALLVKCFGGCGWEDIFRELRGLGLIGEDRAEISPEREAERRQREEVRAKAEIERLRRGIDDARNLYRRAEPAAGTPVEAYLRSRGIVALPMVLRWLRFCPHRNGSYYPAMVAPIVNVRGEQIATHKTFLRPDGSAKADIPKQQQRETRGPMKGGAVRLSEPRADTPLLVAEGIETALSAGQLFGLPAWSAIWAGGLEALELPDHVSNIVTAGDNDASLTGQRAALIARDRWGKEGRRVEILMPPTVGEDFNDLLLRGSGGRS